MVIGRKGTKFAAAIDWERAKFAAVINRKRIKCVALNNPKRTNMKSRAFFMNCRWSEIRSEDAANMAQATLRDSI